MAQGPTASKAIYDYSILPNKIGEFDLNKAKKDAK